MIFLKSANLLYGIGNISKYIAVTLVEYTSHAKN